MDVSFIIYLVASLASGGEFYKSQAISSLKSAFVSLVQEIFIHSY